MSPRRLHTVVKELRGAQGFSQRELAKRAGITDVYITLLETGQRKNPSLAVLKKLAKALGVPVTTLLE
jgi:XRE family transcriptional regulator of biofilm formation